MQPLEGGTSCCYAAQHAHYATADRCRLLNYLVGVPAVIFREHCRDRDFCRLARTIRRAALVVASAIIRRSARRPPNLSALSERAAAHATAWLTGIQPSDAISRRPLHLPVEYRGSAKECLDTVRKEINNWAGAKDARPS